MASFVSNVSAKEMLEAYLSSETLKVMLVNSTYTPNPDTDVVQEGGADIMSAEINVVGYTAGYGSSSRKTLSNKLFTANDSLNRGVFDNTADLVWDALGAGATISGAVIVIEDYLGSTGDDTETRVVIYLQLDTPVATDGSDFQLTFNSNGIAVGQTT